jgi:hypothetical protein
VSLYKQSPVPRSIELPEQGKVVAIPTVGGLHHVVPASGLIDRPGWSLVQEKIHYSYRLARATGQFLSLVSGCFLAFVY